jgi:hypothetical protein
VAAEHRVCRVAEQLLGGPVPGANLAALRDRIRRNVGLLEQRKQLRIQHMHPRLGPPGILARQPQVHHAGVGAWDARIPARYKRFIAERRSEWHSFARSANWVGVDAASRIHQRCAVKRERASKVQNDDRDRELSHNRNSVTVTTWKE